MKNIATILILIFFAVEIGFAQFRGNTLSGKTFSVMNQTQSALPLLQEAELQLRLFDNEETFFSYENAVAQNPYSAEALLLRARFKRSIGMETEAQEDLRLANRLNPYVANLYGYNGANGLASLLDIKPEEAFLGLSTYQTLNYYYPKLDQRYAEKEDNTVELDKVEQIIISLENRDFLTAENILEDLLQEHPGSAIAYDLKGLLLTEKSKPEAAKAAFRQAINLQADFAIAWYNLSRLEHKTGNLKMAKEYLDKAIQLQEDLTKAYFARAFIHKSLGETEKALEDYNKIIDLRGETYMEAYLNRGLTRKMLGDFTGALADLDKVVEEFPDNPEVFKNRGNLYLLFGFPGQAIEDYSKAIQLDENDHEAYYNRGLSHIITYDYISGCYDLNKSMELGNTRAIDVISYFCGVR